MARRGHFDTDSTKILIDNCASASITNDPRDCATPPVQVNRIIRGIGGDIRTDRIYRTTIKWTIEDDDGAPHTILLPRSYYLPESPAKLLSPQHWAQVANDHSPAPRGTYCYTYDDAIELVWAQRRHRRTIPLEVRGSNVGSIHTAPGFSAYCAFCSDAGEDGAAADLQEPIVLAQNLIAPDDLHDETPTTPSVTTTPPVTTHIIPTDEESLPDPSLLPLDELQTEDLFPSPDTFSIDLPHPPPATEGDNNRRATEGASEGANNKPEIDETFLPNSPSAQLLRLHHRTGHTSMRKLQDMAKMGLLPRKLATCNVPICTACAFGKATRRPWRNKPSATKKSRTITRPGRVVSVDQLVSPTPGYIAQLRGTPTRRRYKAATIFVDHASGAGYVHIQRSTSADETIEAKRRFEAWADTHGVSVSHYHADNGIFADNKFRKAVRDDNQTISFCGVNAHFQNGRAERRIRELQDTARTMLIHAHRRWSKAIDAHLWPYALRYAADIYNNTPTMARHGKAPIEIFSGGPVNFDITTAHTFGCPAYVLHNDMQAGKKIPKWTSRARVGIYLGFSAQHARTVSLILSLSSGLTSPQFHVRFDDTFTTVRPGNPQPTSLWQEKAGFTTTSEEKTKKQRQTKPEKRTPTPAPTVTEPTQAPEPTDGPGETETTQDQQEAILETGVEDEAPTSPVVPQPDRHYVEGARRSTRTRRPTPRYQQYLQAQATEFVPYEALYTAQLDRIAEMDPIHAFASSNSDPDAMYWHQAMREPDRDEFLKAAQAEVDSHTKNGLWEVVKRATVPRGALISRGVWAMKRKRRIFTQEVYKWKARLAFDGSKQTKNLNYWDTYAPVISWPIVRFILTLAIIERWKMVQVDFVLAYTQAPVETDMYMSVPKGFKIDGTDGDDYVLKIKKNYYGQKQAGRVWNRHLVRKLKEIGFTQSPTEECLFYLGKTIYILYTDDSILTGPDQREIDYVLRRMKEVGLKITHDDGVDDFLGVNVSPKSDGTIHLTQPHLIDSVLTDLRLAGTTVQPKFIPCPSTVVPGRDLDAAPFDGHFHYRAVIGKLNFLEKTTRPDISYAAHQAARFSSNPRETHGKALKWLGRYLNHTRDKGIILRPDASRGFEVYADADFCGNFVPHQAPRDPDTARSRSGFIIFYARCPLHWQSKLQTEFALSTTEAELISMSQALRAALPIMEIIKELRHAGFPLLPDLPAVKCRLFEDNNGAIELATTTKIRPRTRYINVKWFHFRSYYERKELDILPCDTDDMVADYLTKGLPREPFERHRFTVAGW